MQRCWLDVGGGISYTFVIRWNGIIWPSLDLRPENHQALARSWSVDVSLTNVRRFRHSTNGGNVRRSPPTALSILQRCTWVLGCEIATLASAPKISGLEVLQRSPEQVTSMALPANTKEMVAVNPADTDDSDSRFKIQNLLFLNGGAYWEYNEV